LRYIRTVLAFFSRLRQNSTLEYRSEPERKAGISKAILENINEPSNVSFHQRAFCLTIKTNNPMQGFRSINALLLASGANGC
jgi:hypothetical protein